jgi:hypothetical protein
MSVGSPLRCPHRGVGFGMRNPLLPREVLCFESDGTVRQLTHLATSTSRQTSADCLLQTRHAIHAGEQCTTAWVRARRPVCTPAFTTAVSAAPGFKPASIQGLAASRQGLAGPMAGPAPRSAAVWTGYRCSPGPRSAAAASRSTLRRSCLPVRTQSCGAAVATYRRDVASWLRDIDIACWLFKGDYAAARKVSPAPGPLDLA